MKRRRYFLIFFIIILGSIKLSGNYSFLRFENNWWITPHLKENNIGKAIKEKDDRHIQLNFAKTFNKSLPNTLIDSSVSCIPQQPDSITGTFITCNNTSLSYYIPNDSGVTYTWSCPPGSIITSGQGTNAVTVLFGSNSGDLTVVPSNSCGDGPSRSQSIIVMTADTTLPGVIDGLLSPCPGTQQSYSITNGSDSLSYIWSVPSGWTITDGQNTDSINVITGTSSGNISVSSVNACGTGIPSILTVSTLPPTPNQPDSIIGNFITCKNTSQTYSVTNVPGVSYTWSGPVGSTITSGQGTHSITILFGSNSGVITVVPSGICGNGPSRSHSVKVETSNPAQPSVINGPGTLCQGGQQSYSVINDTSVNSYTWTVPADWTITQGQNTNAMSVITGADSGMISVLPANTCGTGIPKILHVLSPASSPNQPDSITGVFTTCANTSLTYHVTNIPGVTFTWSCPAGSTITSGQGTNSVTILFGFNSGNITVVPSNTCGNGSSQSHEIIVQTSAPAQPGVIYGIVAPCQASVQSFSVINNPDAMLYTWTVPGDWTIINGQNSDSISVIVGASLGQISVEPTNTCGIGNPSVINVNSMASIPASSGPVFGNSGVCLSYDQLYSVNNTSNYLYTWSLPADWILHSGQGTNEIFVTAGANPGYIKVTPSNNCGIGTADSIPVIVDTTYPAQPIIIYIDNNPCQTSLQTYSVVNNTHESYFWTLPSDWTILSGQGTNSIDVLVGAISGDINVFASNTCGATMAQALAVVVGPLPDHPGEISGDSIFCEGASTHYSIMQYSEDSYIWTVPPGWVITSGQGTDSIFVIVGINPGNVEVIPVNGCGNGPSGMLFVNVNPKPVAETGADKGICVGASVNIGTIAVAGSSYSWTSIPEGFISTDANPVVQPDTATTYYMVETNNSTGCSNTDSVSVLINNMISIIVTPSSEDICNISGTSINLTSNVFGTLFSWSAALTSGSGTSGFSNGTGATIAQILTNASDTNSKVTYSITATAASCANAASSVDVTVHPAPVVNSQTITICSDVPTSLILGASINGVAVVTYNITAINTNGLSALAGSPATGIGFSNSVIANDAWINTSINPVNVIYTVVPVSAMGCRGASFTVTITVKPKPSLTNSATKTICSGASTGIALTANVTSTFSWSLGTITGGITGASNGSGANINQTLTDPVNTSAGTVPYIVTPTSTAGLCTGNAITILVTVNPLPVVTNVTSKSICSNTGTAISLEANITSTFSWSLGTVIGGINGASAGSGANINQTLSNPSNTASGNVPYIVTPTSVTGSCAGSATTLTVTVNPLPTVTAGSSVTDVCPGINFNLTSSSNIYYPPILLSENFNGSIPGWTLANNSSGGTPANALWTLRPAGYSSNSQTFYSNDSSQFVMSNSYSQNGTITNTSITSPIINTIGYNSLTLSFWQYYDYNARTGEAAKVQASTNGTTWNNVSTFTSDQGSANNFTHVILNLSAYAGNATLYIRFYYYAGSNRGRYWAIDNVSISGTSPSPVPSISWTSNPVGFSSNAANPINVAQTTTSTYTVLYTNSVTGCSNTASKTVNAYPVPVPTISSDYCAVSGKIQLTGGGGGTYLWSTGETNQIIAVDVAGIYSVTVTNAFGCKAPKFVDAASELVVDGSFTNYNPLSPAFVTGYIQQQTFYNPSAPNPALTGLWPEGDYAVNVSAWYNPSTNTGYHTEFHGKDHTNNVSGPKNFLMINGSTTDTPLKTIWQQTVAVTPNTDYYFSAWGMNLNPLSPARLQFEVNGVLVGTIADLSVAPKPNSEGQVGLTNWVRFYSNPKWNSGSATTAVIRIRNLNTVAGGNDFGLDDISFGTLAPIPFTTNPTSNSEVCAGQTLNLFANINGGRAPINYTWTGPYGFISHLANPSIPNVTAANAGNYTISVVDGYGCNPVVKTIAVSVNPLPTGIVSSTTQVCQFAPSPNITFTGNSGIAPYTFIYNINGGINQTITTTSGNSISLPASTLVPGVFNYNLVCVLDAKGCIKNQTGSAIITVNSLPVCAISGTNPVCAGASGIPYTATAGLITYSWSISGSGSITGTTNTSSISVNAGTINNTSFTLTLNVTDSKGCSGVNSVQMFIEDITNPTLNVPMAQNRFSNANTCTYTTIGTEFNPTSYGDNCQVATVINNLNGTSSLAGFIFPLGTTSVTWTVTDVAGNSTAKSFNVVVRDNQLPIINCLSSQVVCANSAHKYVHNSNLWNATATDNCSVASMSYTLSGATTGSGSSLNGATFNAGITTVKWTVSDGSSNTTNCSFTVTVQTEPIISQQPQDKNVCPYTTQVNFSVAVSLSPTPTFQWRKNGINISGANNATLVINNPHATDAGNYDVVITNTCGSITSQTASLNYPLPLYASHDTIPVYASLGYNPDPLSINGSKSGGVGPFTYQWQVNNSDIIQANSMSYDPPQLNVAGTYIYTCKICDACGTTFTTSGKKVAIEIPLPIELEYFAGDCKKGLIELKWATITETNNEYFTIENSLDTKNWNIVAKIDGAGNSNEVLHYQYSDRNPNGGLSYYRLKQTDFDGKNETFSPISISCGTENPENISIYPNPFMDELTIQYSDIENRSATIKVFDMVGNILMNNDIAVNQGSNKFTLELGNLVVGVYYIEFISGDIYYHQKVIKE